MMLLVFGSRRAGRSAAWALHGCVVLALAFVALLSPAHAEEKSGRPWLGVSMSRGKSGGVNVDHVFKKSPAEKAKLKVGDRIVRADGVVLDKPADLVDHVARHKPGMTIKLSIKRGGKERTVPVVLADHPGTEELARLMHVGNKAYELKGLSTVQGSVPAAIADLEGQVVLLEFFASWCGNCKAMTPQLAALHNKFKNQGLNVIGITSDEADVAAETVKKWKMPYAAASDPNQSTFSAYSVSAIPAVYVIDKKGVIREVLIGFDSESKESTEKLIKKLLAEKDDE
jgi:peroxiredoxin